MPGHAMYVRFVKVNLYLIYSVLVSSSEILSKENRYIRICLQQLLEF